MMHVVSVNVALPREILWKGRIVQTGIFKDPQEGRIAMRRLNLEGDRQADLTVHGGPEKAVYGYPLEHYEFWHGVLPNVALPCGSFGENLTLEGLTEENVHIGDRFRIGTAEVVVTQPRQPCYKLAAKFGRADVVRQMLESGLSGFYFAVQREGDVGAGDPVEVIDREIQAVRVADLNRLFRGETDDIGLMRRAVLVDALPQGWREALQEQIAQV
jgi:MOSC domain-containing protein YiiM